MKVAIIHYWFITKRGGEKVVESLLKLFPEADIYTLFYDKRNYGPFLNNNNVYTSVLDKPFLRRNYQKIFPLYPMGIRSLRLKQDYDLIISSESGPSKGIKINNNAKHICYVHSPMRYCYTHTDMYLKSVRPILRPFMSFFLRRLKSWDQKTISNVDLYISNSKNVSQRVKNFFYSDSEVVYPPISDELFTKALPLNTKKDYYLSFGAITPYKKIDLLIDTFNEIDKDLIIIGQGSEKEKLRKKANNNISFMNANRWEDIERIILNTKALLFPGEEDFGMIPLEIMAYGVPVIAFGKGGALETIIENKENVAKSTGIFFNSQNTSSLNKALQWFEENENKFDAKFIKEHASRFSEKHFLSTFSKVIKDFLERRE